MAWRDEATLTAITLVHAAGADAMRVLEERLDTVAVTDAMIAADACARDIVRPTMRNAIGPGADLWYNAHARALRRVDARLEALALGFAAIGERPSLPADGAAVGVGWSVPAWLRGSVDSLGSAIERAAGEVAARALPDLIRGGVEHVSTSVAREIGTWSGARDRLRAAGRAELASVWQGPASEGSAVRPYLTELFDTIDHAAKRALETIA
jgi:hypothetical protein